VRELGACGASVEQFIVDRKSVHKQAQAGAHGVDRDRMGFMSVGRGKARGETQAWV
jgi:hypothetical protein